MQTSPADYTPVSTLSLRELRADLLQQAARASARARVCRARGEVRAARVLQQRAARLVQTARSVNVS